MAEITQNWRTPVRSPTALSPSLADTIMAGLAVASAVLVGVGIIARWW